MLRFIVILSIGILTACSASQKEEDTATGGKKTKARSRDANPVVDEADDEGDGSQVGGGPDSDAADDGSSDKTKCKPFKDSYNSHATASGKTTVDFFGTISFSVEADAAVRVSSSSKRGSLAIDGHVTQAKPALAKSTAERGLGAYRDPMKMKYAEAAELQGADAWAGLDCLIMATKTLKSQSFDYEFEPALPLLVSPDAAAQDVERTIPVKSTLRRHFEERNGAKAGTYEGVAKISRSGNKVTITYDFGGGAPAIFAAPFASIEYALGGDGKYESITARIYISATDTIPVVLPRQ